MAWYKADNAVERGTLPHFELFALFSRREATWIWKVRNMSLTTAATISTGIVLDIGREKSVDKYCFANCDARVDSASNWPSSTWLLVTFGILSTMSERERHTDKGQNFGVSSPTSCDRVLRYYTKALYHGCSYLSRHGKDHSRLALTHHMIRTLLHWHTLNSWGQLPGPSPWS